MQTALLYATQILGLLPALMSAGKDIATFIANSNAALKAMQAEDRDPTPAEWDQLNEHIRMLQAELHAK